MAFIDFAAQDKYVIAEFIFGYKSDTLIVSDAQDLIEVLNKHNLLDGNFEELKKKIEDKTPGVLGELLAILAKKIDDEQGEGIMQEYYKGGLS